MTYVEGFVIAVPEANRAAFVEHAQIFDALIIEHGAMRVVECWGDDVPPGKVTDFARAVQARDGEAVVFSWIEWPDRATRDAGHARMQELMQSGALGAALPAMPFDGQRMIFGGFAPVVEVGGRQ